MSKRRFDGPWRAACGALLFACMVTANTAHAGDPILAARDAFRAGDGAKLARSVAAARGHVLEPYVQYWNVSLRMGQTPRSEVAAFLQDHEGTLLADKLRTQWLKQLGRNALWQEFDRDYPLLANSDQEIECYALQSRLHRNEAGAMDAARELWLKVDRRRRVPLRWPRCMLPGVSAPTTSGSAGGGCSRRGGSPPPGRASNCFRPPSSRIPAR
ncbi:MAG: hypothetical protein MZW92_49460 [Comamonadaceae bacterium]|nr:hypothetical protein [Comamonadaceae bacterium]